MVHIHQEIDFVVVAFIVYKNKTLLLFHKKLQKWLSPGGHIELNEEPEQALFREIKEETGIGKENLVVLSSKPKVESTGTKFLFTPNFLDLHDISPTHKHIGMVYFLISKTDKITLSDEESEQIGWFSREELESGKLNLSNAVKFYAKEVIKDASNYQV